jgi:hypothetical protein
MLKNTYSYGIIIRSVIILLNKQKSDVAHVKHLFFTFIALEICNN